MVSFDKEYCEKEFPSIDYPHFKRRAIWISERFDVVKDRIYIAGIGYGWILTYLYFNNIKGIEKSNYLYDNGVAKDHTVHVSVADFTFSPSDIVLSWNMLDALENEAEAEAVCASLNKSGDQYHILCTDLGDFQSEAYKKNGFLIKDIEYWLSLLPSAKLIDYHSGEVYNAKSLKIPLSWDLTSK